MYPVHTKHVPFVCDEEDVSIEKIMSFANMLPNLIHRSFAPYGHDLFPKTTNDANTILPRVFKTATTYSVGVTSALIAPGAANRIDLSYPLLTPGTIVIIS